MPERLAIQPLDPSMHDRGAFSCGKPPIDKYFREVAAQAGQRLHAQTYVLTNVDQPPPKQAVMGFYTLTPHEYRDDEMEASTARALRLSGLRRIPAILLGQLGIAVNYKGRGLGRMLLDHAFRKALFASVCVGGALLITDPIDDDARSFYLHYEFQGLRPGTRLYIAMKTLAKAYPAVVAEAKRSLNVGDG